MDYALIGKIEKSKIYAAEQQERIRFEHFAVQLTGENGATHAVGYKDGQWSCDCTFFEKRGFCSHTMAMERILGSMLTEETAEAIA